MNANLMVYYVACALVPIVAREQGASWGQAACITVVMVVCFLLGWRHARAS